MTRRIYLPAELRRKAQKEFQSLFLRHSWSAGQKKSARRCEKPEKPFLTVLQRQLAIVQAVPTRIAQNDFSDFSKNFRGGGGVGVADFSPTPNPNPNMAQLPVHPVNPFRIGEGNSFSFLRESASSAG
jgi:hypothetical protein